MGKAARAGAGGAWPGVDDTTLGIVLFVLGVSLGSIQGGLAKLLVAELPVAVVLWWRFLGVLVIVLPFAIFLHGVEALAPRRPLLHVFRAALLLASSAFFAIAVGGLPLADTIAIVFVYPFLVTALAPMLLKERVGPSSWIAVATGFAGVLVVVRPGLEGLDWHAFAALACGAAFALSLLVTRKLLVAAPATVTATWTAATAVIVLGAFMPLIWVTPDERQLLLLLLLGAMSAAAQIVLIVACARCDMGVLAPFGYAEIVAATATGLVMFGDVPDWITWVGIAIIVASGLTIALSKGLRLPLLSRSRQPATH